jgi:hypothetical protein
MKWEEALSNRHIQIVERCNREVFVTAHNVERAAGAHRVSSAEQKQQRYTGGKGFPVPAFVEFIEAHGFQQVSASRNVSGDIVRQWRKARGK